jgi:hypothetical protein
MGVKPSESAASAEIENNAENKRDFMARAWTRAREMKTENGGFCRTDACKYHSTEPHPALSSRRGEGGTLLSGEADRSVEVRESELRLFSAIMTL